MAEVGAYQCRTLSPYLREESMPSYQQHCMPEYEDWSIPKLLQDIRDKLEAEKTKGPIREAEAVAKLQEDLTFIEGEYDTLPQIIDDYESVYPGFKEPGAIYCTAERQWHSIKDWVCDANLDDATQDAIKQLRADKYLDKTEGDLPADHPCRKSSEAEQTFRSLQTCLVQRTEKEASITNQYTTDKDFKTTVEGWFAELTMLHGSAQEYFTKKKQRSLFALYLDACQVWKKIQGLCQGDNPQNPAWLKKLLTEGLKQSLFAKHERFLWHDDWLKKETAVTTTAAACEAFTSSRRKNFIREAEDVQPPMSWSHSNPEPKY